MKLDKKIFIFIIIILIIIFAFIFYNNKRKTEEAEVEKQTDSAGNEEEIIENDEKINNSILTTILNNSTTEKISLAAVDGSNSKGIGYRLIKDGKLFHIVIAEMPKPIEGNNYEGWLVQLSPLKFFSTGVMKENSNGDWILEYESDKYQPEYNQVVITLETVVDATPEKHIIEGQF